MKRIFFLCCIITLFCNSCNDESEVFLKILKMKLLNYQQRMPLKNAQIKPSTI